MDEDVPATGGPTACEECEAAGARPTRVLFVGDAQSTLDLCENCASEFEAADLVERTDTIEVA